jgi:hypothetical protein
MQAWLKLSIALLCSCSSTSTRSVSAFVPTLSRSRSRVGANVPPILGMAAWDDEDEAQRDAAVRRNQARTDVRNFLTQRAIQSFMFLLHSCRDPHTVRWLEHTYGFTNLLEYHGSGAFNLTIYPEWDSILQDMTSRPSEVVIVSARRRGGGHGGWSKDNPYLEDRFVEFEIDIDPPSLVSRLISVRDQIAKEWVVDLDTLVKANDMILTSYTEKHLSDRASEECQDFDQPEECMEIENLTAPYSNKRQEEKKAAFERNAMVFLSNTIHSLGQGSSPHRKGNFDLLILLATQESVHRVLRAYRDAGDEREVSFSWLREFYVSRVSRYFDGNQEYGRADDFVEELLLTPPSLKTSEIALELIDPMRMAEDIIAMRSEVARDWKTVMQASAEDHMALQRIVLAARMGKMLETSSGSSKEEKTPTSTPKAVVAEAEASSLDGAGAFE